MQISTSKQLYRLTGTNVAKLRKEKKLSQLNLSLAMGYKSVSVVLGTEVHYNNIHFNIEQLLKISQILGIDICEFFKAS